MSGKVESQYAGIFRRKVHRNEAQPVLPLGRNVHGVLSVRLRAVGIPEAKRHGGQLFGGTDTERNHQTLGMGNGPGKRNLQTA